MPKLTYNWKRFWCPTTGQIKYDYRGFLDNPESEYGDLTNPDVVPFSAISDLTCLVLLGEAGIGKTTAIEQEYKQLENCLSQTDDICLWFKLGDYSSEEALFNNIFRNNDFQAWINGTHKLYLFLDSLDEGLLSVKILVRLLKREIEKLPGDRLYFRITCRTADWPNSLEDKLKEKWDEAKVGIYELAPLREIDVLEAAQQNNINSDKFLQELINREAIPLAINPVTLKFLLDTYRKYGQFPRTKKELYEKGCLQLCTEVNQDRYEAGCTGEFSAKQRLIVAGRIAALTIFANRAAVWTNPAPGNMPNSDIATQDLSGEESIDEQSTVVNEKCIKEVLSITGLFSSRGTDRMGFAHQTYAEFLAAWYLVQHQVPLVQVMSLLVAPGDPDRKLVPQLHETAAWLASMRNDVSDKIISTDPDVLLRSDIPKDPKVKAAIVTQLLRQYEEDKIPNEPDDYKYQGYKKLLYPTLHKQLLPYIQDAHKKFQVRYEAITIATSCEIKELQDDLVNLALDSSQPIRLRVKAALYLCSVGNKNTKSKLKPLVIRELEEDEDDQLKGFILRALWPDCLTAKEIFSFITPPKRHLVSGSYQRFLEDELVSNLQPNDLVIALNWFEQKGLRGLLGQFENSAADAIILKAWEHFDISGVAEAIAKIAWIKWQNKREIITNGELRDEFKSFIIRDSQKRYTLIEKIIEILSTVETDRFLICFLISKLREELVLEGDVLWMLTKINKNESETKQKNWSILIERIFNRQNAKEIDAILTATQINHVLKEKFASYFDPIDLDSDQATKMKADYKERHDQENRRENQPVLEPPPTEQVTLLLDQLESGDLSAWWELNREMTLKPDSRYYGNEFESDLTKLPGWQEANRKTQQRIIKGAQKYIQYQVEVTTDWIGTNTYPSPALAGCRAFQLLLKESPDLLKSISPEIWQRWASVIIAYPHYDPSKPDYLELVKLAYLNAASETINTIIDLIDCENKKCEYTFITRKLDRCWKVDRCWDDRLKITLLKKAKDTVLQPKFMESLLEALIQQDFDQAREYAKSLISLPLDESQRQKSLIAAKLLIQYAEPSSWVAVWSAIQDNTDFGRQVIEDVADDPSKDIHLKLTEKQLADFYIWLVRQYPPCEDPAARNVGIIEINERQRIAEFRSSIREQLTEKGTSESCLEIQRIVQEFPELTWLKQVLLKAQNIRRSKDWCPPTTSELLRIVKNSEKRLVQDGNQLLDVLVEALQYLELKLQGETPAARDIWDELSHKKYKPVSENEFSDYVKRFLDEQLKIKGIVINREVELRSGTGGNKGERTDIHVDAVSRKSNGQVLDRITAIIEVKGCWHGDLSHAMKTQLVNRYLQDNTCKHGLYLVGWFYCSQWYDNDSIKKKSPKISLEQAIKQFNEQAEQLSKKNNIQVRAFVLNAALR